MNNLCFLMIIYQRLLSGQGIWWWTFFSLNFIGYTDWSELIQHYINGTVGIYDVCFMLKQLSANSIFYPWLKRGTARGPILKMHINQWQSKEHRLVILRFYFRNRVKPWYDWMGQFLGLPEVLEIGVEDENHLGLVGPKEVLRFVCSLVLPRDGRERFVVLRPFRGTTRLQTNRQHLF